MALGAPLPVVMALSGQRVPVTVRQHETAGAARERLAAALGQAALRVQLLQAPPGLAARTLEDHEILEDGGVSVVLRDFPQVMLRHNHGKPAVWFAASRERAEAGRFLQWVGTPARAQLLATDPKGRGGWAHVRIPENADSGWPEEVFVRQAHVFAWPEEHVRAAATEPVPSAHRLVRLRHSGGDQDVRLAGDEGRVPSNMVVAVDEKELSRRQCRFRWLGRDRVVSRQHVRLEESLQPFDGAVKVEHREGRGSVVYHARLEDAQSQSAGAGTIPSGSTCTVLAWDHERGAAGWTRVTWRGREVWVRQAHVRIPAAEPV
jgi:hypothetical protein